MLFHSTMTSDQKTGHGGLRKARCASQLTCGVCGMNAEAPWFV